MSLRYVVELKGGRWLVNDKKIEDLDNYELLFFNNFFKKLKNQNPNL